MVDDKLVTSLTGGLGMGVLPVDATTFPAGTIFACLPHAPMRDADGQVITDRNRMRSKLLAFTPDGQTLGEIDMGTGRSSRRSTAFPSSFPMPLAFDASGNLFVADTALAGDQFEPPFENKGVVWMIPAGALDDLAAGKRPGHPDGVEVSPVDGKG